MRHLTTILKCFILICCLPFYSISQYSGTIANDWTLMDINGNTHNLYTLLDQGKTVYLEFSATWCGICWNFHSSHVFEDLYQQYGPSGTGEIMVFFIETDVSTNESCLYGPGNCNGSSAGNWTAGVSYPIVNATNTQCNALNSEYSVNGYPELAVVCPSRRKWVLPNTTSLSFMSNYIASCDLNIDNVMVTDADCQGTTLGAIDIDVSGGYGTLSYSWNNGETTQDLENLPPGQYAVTVTDENNVFVVETTDVQGSSATLGIELVNSQNPSCPDSADGSISVSGMGGNPGYSYSWNTGATGSEIMDLAAGTYTVTITDNDGCMYSDSYTLTPAQSPTVSTIIEPAECGESTGFLAVNAQGISMAMYDIGNGPQSDYEFNNLAGGNYTLTITYGNGCTYTEPITIPSTDGPEVSIVDTDTMLDCDENSMTLQAQVIGDINNLVYLWSTTDGTIIGSSNNVITTVSSGGTYYFTATDTSANCMTTDTVVIAEAEGPQVNAGEDAQITCGLSYVQLSGVYEYDGSVSISWSTDDGHILLGAAGLTPLVDEAGTYTLTVTAADGCSSSDMIEVEVYDNSPEASFTFASSMQELSFTSTSEGEGNTYAWDFGDGHSSTMENPTHQYTQAGMYTVCLTTTNECGSDQACQEINVSAIDINISAEIMHVTCYGDSDGSITLTNNSTYEIASYNWNNGSTGASIDGLSGGVYTVTVTTTDGFSTSNSYTIEEPDELIATVVSVEASSGSIDITVSGGVPPYTYLWNNGSREEDQTGLEEGSYTVKVTDANKCSVYVNDIVLMSSAVEDVLATSYRIMPNPTSDFVHIYRASDQSPGQYILRSSKGEVMYYGKITEGHTIIDLKEFPSGLLLLMIKENDQIFFKKIIKL